MKRNLSRVFSLLLVGLALASATLAQQPHPVPAEELDGGSSSTMGLPAGKTQTSLPFRLVNYHVILPIKVNGAGPFQVILDTGMPMEGLLLYDSDKVEALHLGYLDHVQARVGGVGGKGRDRTAKIAGGVTLEVGDLKISNARATVLTPEPGFGVYHDGIIGASLFNHFAVSLDYDQSLLTLTTPETYLPPEAATALPLTLDHGRVYVQAVVRLGDGEAIPVSLVVDLGASHAISLNEKPANHLLAPKGSITASIGRGMSGMVVGHVGRIRSLKLGNQELASVVATFPEKANESAHVDFHDGNLGDGALSRFNLTFDYAGGRLLLQPNKSFSEAFEWDMSGIQAEPTGEGSVRVSRVLPGSPAAQAGIQEADRLLKIAGEEVTEQSFFSLRERLKKDGDTVLLRLQRGDKQIDVSLKLRRLV